MRTIRDAITAEAYEATYMLSSAPIEEQLTKAKNNAPFDEALIIPQFGVGSFPILSPYPVVW
jgi:hypothetical protein